MSAQQLAYVESTTPVILTEAELFAARHCLSLLSHNTVVACESSACTIVRSTTRWLSDIEYGNVAAL